MSFDPFQRPPECFASRSMEFDAIPPSSPPHATTMPDGPSSPFFEPRDRALELKSSSPPPLFSSDDSRESVDVTNYESPRIYKNKRKGAWWDNGDSAHNTPESKKTKMSRNYDSGVYMMSDASESSVDSLPIHKSPFPFGLNGACDQPPNTGAKETEFDAKIRTGLERNLEIYEFREQELEDDDIERVGDLASVIKNLPDPGNDLPAEGQYRSMVPELYLNLSKNRLCRLTPSLFNVQYLTTLILRNNEIEELPQDIGKLHNLKALDVSLNKLQSLPFEILKLLHYGCLERLITMGNPLLEPMSSVRFRNNVHARAPLPTHHYSGVHPIDIEWEEASANLPILYDGLSSCQDRDQAVWRIRYFEAWANAFGGAEDALGVPKDARDDAADEDLGVYEHHPSLIFEDTTSESPRYMARTLVSYFDQAGHRAKNSPAPPRSDNEEYTVIIETNRGTYGTSPTWFEPVSRPTVASLLTTSLHNAFKSRHADDITIGDIARMAAGSPSQPLSYEIDAIFTTALENDAGGFGEFRQCHVCNKDYVVARAEWVEFWSAGLGVFYPLKVKVCSWGCVPAEVAKKPTQALTW